MTQAPGRIRDEVVGYLHQTGVDASLGDITAAVIKRIGFVSASSVRSYLNLNTPALFQRTERGRYRIATGNTQAATRKKFVPVVVHEKATLYHADCFEWLAARDASSIQAVVTDPPYGLLEYSENELSKLNAGRGSVWRLPPSFDGHKRSPLPRFTILDAQDRKNLFLFFSRLGALLSRVVVPGANIAIASNPLLSHIVASAMSESGLEFRGQVVRLTMTMRGGDRPKNAHLEFQHVSVMPRSMWEPWVIFRKPLEGRVQDNLRKWGTGGFRRPSDEKPFGDVIKSGPTSRRERSIAPHPSLKPQEFLRQIVRASLPLCEGTILDPFAGSGSTLAASNAVGYSSIGIEANSTYVNLASKAIAKLGALDSINPV